MSLRALTWRAFAIISLLTAASTALTITATNSTFNGSSINFTVTSGSGPSQSYGVYPLTPNSNVAGLSGLTYFANTTRQNIVSAPDVVFISCDGADYPGNLQAADLFTNIQNTYSYMATVFYSRTSSWCQPSGDLGTHAVFSMTSASQAQNLTSFLDGRSDSITIGQSANGNGGGAGGDNGNGSTTTAPTGTTLVMIILYSITGCITALFMFIVIGGAIKARRHLDRYGRQVVGGQVRQTRAGGLARAMLDTIPIVKFGQREPVKDADVELGEAQPIAADTAPVTTIHEGNERKQPLLATNTVEYEPSSSSPTEADGIGAAGVEAAAPDHAQGCSICTEDFEIGQDQRVLPCDHRYHPACVDPWLLNVSATCPLCRIDLRPPEEQEASTEVEEPSRDEAAPLPPFAGAFIPASRRRSVFLAIAGRRRPEGMTREERIEALRHYREQHEPATASIEASSTDIQQQPEVQTQNRALRLLNVRTWRTTARARRSPPDTTS